MTDITHEQGIIITVVEHFEKLTLPRALDIKAKVDGGERLDDWDIKYLNAVLVGAEEIKCYVDRRPDLQQLYTRAINLYEEITEKALENEQDA
jgi:hypothetical protein